MQISLATTLEDIDDEAAWIQRARDDPAAFELLYLRYRDRIYRYLRARTASDEDAADLTQQVFVRVFDRLWQYHGRRGSFATWLFSIARHAATDFHRSRRPTVALDGVTLDLQISDDHDPEADALQREALARLRPLLAALPEDKRELLALRFAASLTIAEIATVIGKSVEATRKQITRTLQTLEDHYHESD
jgi:RNA polymerase sigma-70 factor (ECF subfamily)